MNCKQAKSQVALLIGNDLEPAALADVRQHLGQCGSCRQHFDQLSNCLDVLQTPPRGFGPDEESLWPKLSVRLASPTAGQKPHRLNGWAPSLAVAAACTAMFWVASKNLTSSNGVEQAVPPGEVVYPTANRPSENPNVMPLPNSNRPFPVRPRVQKPSNDQSGTMQPGEQGSGQLVPVNDPSH
jgi:predicted anti-sigma-YlaC factor YlaD